MSQERNPNNKRKRTEDSNKGQNDNIMYVPRNNLKEWKNQLFKILSYSDGIPISLSSINIPRKLDGSIEIGEWEKFCKYIDELHSTSMNDEPTLQETNIQTFQQIINLVIENEIENDNNKIMKPIDIMNIQMVNTTLKPERNWWQKRAKERLRKYRMNNLQEKKGPEKLWKRVACYYGGNDIDSNKNCPFCESSDLETNIYVNKNSQLVCLDCDSLLIDSPLSFTDAYDGVRFGICESCGPIHSAFYYPGGKKLCTICADKCEKCGQYKDPDTTCVNQQQQLVCKECYKNTI